MLLDGGEGLCGPETKAGLFNGAAHSLARLCLAALVGAGDASGLLFCVRDVQLVFVFAVIAFSIERVEHALKFAESFIPTDALLVVITRTVAAITQ